MPAKIVVVGSFNTDLTSYMERLPGPGETVNGRKFVVGPGGKGSNQAVAAARLGAEVTFVGRVGNDHYGHTAHELWYQEGINTDHVIDDKQHSTGVAPIFVDDSGENMIVVALGANLALTPADVDAAADVIAQADVLLTQLEIPQQTVEHALRMARQHDAITILNPAPAAHLPTEFLALADIMTPNQTELLTLTGKHSQSLELDAEALLTTPTQTIVLTMGAWGAMWVRQDGHAHVEPFDVEAVDSTGAGDAFNGGLAVALAEGMDIDEAVRFAGAAAALCVTKPGTAPSMPTRAEVEALLSRASG